MKKKLKKSTLGQQTADILRERIILGEYSQGERLIEEDIADEFDISRATVRESLRILEAEGLLIRKINKSTFVRTFSEKEIKALFFVRAILEKQSIEFCISNNCIPEDELLKYLEEMEHSTRIGSDAWNEYLQADIGFHLSTIKAMDNPYITEFWKHLQSQYLMVVYMLIVVQPGYFFGASEEHRRIFEQLLVGNLKPWFKHLENLELDVNTIIKQLK